MIFWWFDGLLQFTTLTPILPLIILFIFKTTIPFKIRGIITTCLMLSIISDWVSLYLGSKGINNGPVIHVYTVFVGIGWFLFYKEIINVPFIKSLILFVIIGLLLIFIGESFVFDKIFEANKFAYGFTSVVLVFFSLVFFFIRLETIQSKNEIFDYLFWINCAILIYFGSTIVLTIFEDLIAKCGAATFYSLWTIQLVSTVLFNFILAKGIWTAKKV